MKLVSTFYPPSSVLDSLKCTLSDGNGSEFLVVAKLSRVDIYSLQPEGLHYETGIEIWGRIRAIKSVPDVHTSTVSLLVLTDHPDPELVFLLFTAAKSGEKDLTVTTHLPLFERNARPAEFCHDVLVDPSGAVAVVSIYAGKLKIVVLTEEGGYERDSDASVLELNLLSLAFITTSAESYTLAMLHFDFQQRLQLLARDIQIDDLQLSPTPSQLLPPLPLPGRWFSIEEQTPRLIFVPSIESRDGDIECEGGVLVVGGRKILLYELASGDALEQNVRKSRRTEKKKKSRNVDESADAKQKEKEREWKKKKARAAITWPWSEVTALCPLTQENDKFMIGDKYGRLAVLHVDRTNGTVLTLVALGEASSPMTLTYLTNQVVYLGSHFGDSQLLQITPSPVSSSDFPTLPIPAFIPTAKPKDFSLATESRVDEEGGIIVNGNGSYLIELESFNNLAPIVDGILTVIDGTGQNEIVTCSGGRNTGSLKVVKSGADFREAAALHGISAVDRIWSLREKYSDQTTSHIVVSTFQETHVLRFEGDKGNMVSSVGGSDMGFLSSRTLAASNIQRRIPGSQPPYVDSSLVVQVVPEGVLLLEYDPGLRVYTRIGDLWTLDKFSDGDTASWANREIVAADINASQVVIALNHGRLVLLKLDGNRFVRQRKREFVEPPPLNCTAEISTVTCLPLDSTKSYAVNIAVGFWMSNVVKILSLERDGTMKDVCVTSVLPAAPRSLLLYSFTGESGGRPEPPSHPHLLIGLVDGSVATFPFQKGTLGDQKLMSIGNLPVTMHTCRIRGRSTVFACGNRTSILYWERDRLQHSPLMLKDISAAAELNTVAYPSSVVLASPDALVIGAVANFDKLHIRSIPLGYDSPRRIVHSPSCGIFAVACTRSTPAQIGQPETFTSTVQVFNHTSFGKLSEFEVEEGEEVTSLHAFTATLSDVPTSLLCAGITSYDDGEREPSRGRLVLLQPNGSRASLVVMASVTVRGCVYAIASRQNMVLAAVNSSVVVYNINIEETEKQVLMTEASTFNHNYLITTLVSRNDRLLIGDALTSVSLLKLTGSKIEPIAKDYGSLWPTCAELLNENTIVGGNSDYNLFSFRLQVNELHKVLEREGHYYLGDIVNKFLPGVLASHGVSVDIPMVPKQLFVTPAGQIGVIIDVTDDDLSLHMTALQRNLSTFYERKTGVSHSKYRAPKNNTGGSDLEATSVGFLDGDFLELFLGYMKDERSLKRIMEGQSEPERLTLSPDQYQKVLEGLQSLH